MFDEFWSEINDAQGEIFDVIEYKEEWEKEEKFDVEGYINGNTDYWYIVAFLSTFDHTNIMTDNLEMLTAREQLMEDIDCIIESNFGEVEYKDDVIRQLCDAVCRNFPAKWHYQSTADP